ncbi:MAG: hypothetical protein JWM45_362 [Pseudonocardiales bacterium]|nr:hypothetical protein [Pseudonocardiales bacterium]
MIITIIVVVLAGAVSRWVRAGEREIRSSEERRTPGGCLSSVASLLAGGDGSTRLGGGAGRVAVWPCSAGCTVRAERCCRPLLNNLHGKFPGYCHPVVRVRGAGCCGIVWRHGLRADYPKAPPGGGASAAPRGQRYEPGGRRRGARLVDQQGEPH